MSDLLPPNATDLERIATAVGAKATDLPVILRSLWDPEDCPAELLPWLAWAWSADEWSAAWSERQMRDSVKACIEVQSIKGTIGAVRSSLGALGIDARVQEWFAQLPEADPYTFRLWLTADQTPVDQSGIAAALAVVNATKNLRSHLTETLVSARSEARVYVASVAGIGHEITVTAAKQALVVINEHAFVLGD